MNKFKLFSLKELFLSFSSISLKFLHFGLPTVLIYLFVLLFKTLSASEMPPNVLAHIYSPMLEYIIMTLTITLIGAFVADIAERNTNK